MCYVLFSWIYVLQCPFLYFFVYVWFGEYNWGRKGEIEIWAIHTYLLIFDAFVIFLFCAG